MKKFGIFVGLAATSFLLVGWIDVEIEAPVVLAEGGEAELVAIAPEGAGLAWELTEDGLFDEGDQVRPLFSARGIDGPTERLVALRVEEGGEIAYRVARIEIANVAPIIVSEPPTVARRGRFWEYRVLAEDPGVDDADGLYFHLADNVAPEDMVVTDDGRVRWTPREKDLGTHLVRVLVEDRDGGIASQNFLVEVVDDMEPFPPNPWPMPAQCFFSLQPLITIGNTNDPDGDALHYFFEVAEDTAFEGTDVVASSAVEEGRSGLTSWTVTRPLDAGEIYYWRAWASDGLQRSDEVRGALCIQPDETPVDPPTETPIDSWDIPGPNVQNGCSAIGGSPAASLGTLLTLLALVRRRRR